MYTLLDTQLDVFARRRSAKTNNPQIVQPNDVDEPMLDAFTLHAPAICVGSMGAGPAPITFCSSPIPPAPGDPPVPPVPPPPDVDDEDPLLDDELMLGLVISMAAHE